MAAELKTAVIQDPMDQKEYSGTHWWAAVRLVCAEVTDTANCLEKIIVLNLIQIYPPLEEGGYFLFGLWKRSFSFVVIDFKIQD